MESRPRLTPAQRLKQADDEVIAAAIELHRAWLVGRMNWQGQGCEGGALFGALLRRDMTLTFIAMDQRGSGVEGAPSE